MLKDVKFTYFFIFIVLVFTSPLMQSNACQAQMNFNDGDWISYTNFRQINDIAVGRDLVYIATDGGVLRYNRYREEWLDPWVKVRGLDKSIDLRYAVNVDYLSENDEVAVLTSRGSYIYNKVSKYWKSTSHDFEDPVLADIEEPAFLNTPDFVLSRRSYFYQGNNTVMDDDLRKWYFGVYADDQWKDWWVGLPGVGMIQVEKNAKRGIVWELGLFGQDIRAIEFGRKWMILAGHNRDGGISFWKRKKNIWDHFEWQYTSGLESTWINDLTVTGKWLLAATDYGLAQIDLKNGSCRTWTVYDGLWSNQTTCVATEKDTAWVGTNQGVSKLFLHKGPILRIEQEPLFNQPIYRVEIDPEAVWFGGELGIFRLDRESGKIKLLGNEGGVGGAVWAMHSTPTELWVGRFTGIEVIEKASMEHRGYPSQAHLKSAEIYAIHAEGDLVWIGTNKGLWKFDRKRNYWHQYKEEDGLLDDHVFALYPDGDHILIGTAEGLTRFLWHAPGRID